MLEFERERCGSLDGQDVSIDGVNIPVVFKLSGIFAERISVLLNL